MPSTYRQYYKNLLKELTGKEIKTRHKQFEIEILKRGISHEQKATYIVLHDELNSLISKCERFTDMVINGKVSLSDEVDPNVLLFEVESANEATHSKSVSFQ
jgi:hypothetical protein